jgi:(S)-2-hydroxy-acid oxidase
VEDAELAAYYQVDAIWISNHGGRQLDTVRATVDILADVTKSKGYTRKSNILFRKGS